MGKYKEKFIIYPVQKTYQLKDGTKKTSKKRYYVSYYDINGDRQIKPTGETSEGAARTVVLKLISEGMLETSNADITFQDYSKDWWIWSKCNYVSKKRAKGKQIGKTYVELNRLNLENHILPFFKDIKLKEIKKKTVEDWLLHLYEKTDLSPTTINHNLTILKTMLKEAVFNEILIKNPTEGISQFTEKPKEKNIISGEQYVELFQEGALKKHWKNNIIMWTLNGLAADTGMRMGEIQALQVQDVKPGLVYVTKAWTRKHGLNNQTKRKESDRRIKISSSTYEHLQKIIKLQKLNEDNFIFPSPVKTTEPIGYKAISNSLYSALQSIGINENMRKEKNITFHSWRHFYNTFLKGKTDDERVYTLIGHTNQRTNDGYFKIDDKKYLEIMKDVPTPMDTILKMK